MTEKKQEVIEPRPTDALPPVKLKPWIPERLRKLGVYECLTSESGAMPYAKSVERYGLHTLHAKKAGARVFGQDIPAGAFVKLPGNLALDMTNGVDAVLEWVPDERGQRAAALAAELEELSRPRPAREREEPPAATTSDTNSITGRGLARR